MTKQLWMAAIAWGACIQCATAHVALENPTAAAGSYYKATFMVSHGCAGSATKSIVVQLPEEITFVKPMPKPGWSMELRGAAQVSWSGGPLPDAYYDEFVMLLKLPDHPGNLYFKVSQQCEQGRQDWVQVPEAGKSAREYKFPAPSLRVEGTAMGHEHH